MIEQLHAAELEEFDRGWSAVIEQTPFATLVTALGGLTRLGEHPASLARLAGILDRSVPETTALIRENTTARIEDGLIHWDEPFPGEQTRRTLYVGDRTITMNSGCAPDLFAYAAVLDVPFRVEETCPATGTLIRVEFVPGGYQRADPPEAVTLLLALGQVQKVTGGSFDQVNTTLCSYQPFFASAQAAEAALAARPGSRAFTVNEMFERPFVTHYRDNLRPLVHPRART